MPRTFRQSMPRGASFELSPVGPLRRAFDEAFAAVNAAWPGLDLGYVGSKVDRKTKEMVHYFQLRGVSSDYALVMEEAK